MKRFLFKFFFVLFALIAALPAQANYVFFKNTLSWSNVYVYFYNGEYWDKTNNPSLGSGSKGIAANAMSKIYGTDIYAYDHNGSYSQYISFTEAKQGGYDNFWQTKAAYCGDFSFDTPLFTPDKNSTGKLNQTDYYNNGSWSTFSWSDYTYWIQHDWGGSGNSTWKQLNSNGDGTYSVDAVYGGGGCNYSTTSDDSSAPSIESPTLVNNPQKGDNCTFTFNPITEEITITKNATQLAAPTFTPDGDAYTSAQRVTISAADGATIYYTTDKTVPTTSSTEYSGPITVSKTTTIRAIAVKDGYTNSEIAEATYTINSTTPTPTTGKIYVPVSEYDKTVAYIYSWDANNDNYKLFGDKGTPMTKETVNGVAYWTVTVESSKLPATVTGWILHNGSWQDKASNNNNTDLPGVTFQDGYVYHINGTSEPIIYINAPTFSPEGGEITSAQNVTISAANGATIYYTTDGTDPTTSSTKYESAITVSKTTTIKAIAVKDGHTSSIASATYTLVEPECWYLPDASTSNAVQMTRNADGSFSLTINIDNDKTFLFSKKNSTATADILGSTAGNNSDYWVKEDKLNHDITLVPGTTQKFIMKAGAGIYKITVSADYTKVKLVNKAAQVDGIPVFPLGVNSEAE
ncbi:MAG: chitobiase/beta-hexosaminidase C-terminal domain-containing protein, partial [bacterium]|nr:chitobiase/beta-hexosaminidase C-terminal domain-containing protein [bacterium]